jgi:hypothetical protein
MTHSSDDPRHGPGGAQGQDFFNSGVYIGEGTFNGPVAAGYQARAVQVNQAGSGDDRARLEDLLQQLEGGLRQLGGAPAEAALADVSRVRNELEQHPVDPPRIGHLLQRITAVVAPVSGLLELADRVKELIMAILH